MLISSVAQLQEKSCTWKKSKTQIDLYGNCQKTSYDLGGVLHPFLGHPMWETRTEIEEKEIMLGEIDSN